MLVEEHVARERGEERGDGAARRLEREDRVGNGSRRPVVRVAVARIEDPGDGIHRHAAPHGAAVEPGRDGVRAPAQRTRGGVERDHRAAHARVVQALLLADRRDADVHTAVPDRRAPVHVAEALTRVEVRVPEDRAVVERHGDDLRAPERLGVDRHVDDAAVDRRAARHVAAAEWSQAALPPEPAGVGVKCIDHAAARAGHDGAARRDGRAGDAARARLKRPRPGELPRLTR